ncbi:MAG TPA: hypothetical protein ENI90_04295 [Methylothermaceae bacterium]|nr:hypothetical protein [Methylothermaceae bacterium]
MPEFQAAETDAAKVNPPIAELKHRQKIWADTDAAVQSAWLQGMLEVDQFWAQPLPQPRTGCWRTAIDANGA